MTSPRSRRFMRHRRALAPTLAAVLLPTPAAAAAELPPAQVTAAAAEFLMAPARPAPERGVICIVDSGVDETRDLEGQLTARVNIDPAGPVADRGEAKHGTYVASVAVARADNEWGIAGIYPAGKVYSVNKDGDPNNPQAAAPWYAGIRRCIEAQALEGVPVKAINLSLGHTASEVDEQTKAIVADHVALAHKHSISVVAAAGNTGSDVEYPAAAEGVFAVGASTRDGDWCPSSARGVEVDISALGCGVTIAVGEDGRRGLSEGGTSLSAPQAAAALVALRDYKPELTWEQAENLLRTSNRKGTAGPLLDVAAAFRDAGLSGVIPPAAPPPPPPPAATPVCNPARAWCRPPELVAIRRAGRTIVIELGSIPKRARVTARADGRRVKVRRRGRTVRIRPRRRFGVLELRFRSRRLGSSAPLRISRRLDPL